MSASLLPLAVSAEEAHNQLPMPAVMYAVIAFGLFLVGLGVLWTFRKTYAKVPQRPTGGHGGGQHGGQHGGPGHGDPGAPH